MISSLQPSRPKIHPPPKPTPANRQPTRSLSALSTSTPSYSPQRPRTQIEAMPPTPLPRSPLQIFRPQVLLDASKRHPVFFTDRLKKVPTGVNAGGGWGSPVAKGYVFNDGARKAQGGVKL